MKYEALTFMEAAKKLAEAANVKLETKEDPQAETRKQLKNVRKELTADIDALGLRLKVANIALVPVLVVLFGLLRGYLRRRRA